MGKTKAFNVRLPKELWAFVKMKSIQQEISMNEIIVRYIEKAKKQAEKKLLDNDTKIS